MFTALALTTILTCSGTDSNGRPLDAELELGAINRATVVYEAPEGTGAFVVNLPSRFQGLAAGREVALRPINISTTIADGQVATSETRLTIKTTALINGAREQAIEASLDCVPQGGD